RDAQGDLMPAGAQTRLGTIRWRQENEIVFLAYLPDGKHILTRGSNGLFHVWDRQTGLQARQFDKARKPEEPKKGNGIRAGKGLMMRLGNPREQDPDGIRTVALAADGQHVATTDLDGTIRLWEVASGKEIRYWKAPARKKGLLDLVVSAGDE